jgi:Arc/MetJ family transcription regulator
MRTNIEIDDSLMQEAMEVGQIRTKKQTIEFAVKEFIAAAHRRKLMDMRGKVLWEGNLDEWRTQDVQDI